MMCQRIGRPPIFIMGLGRVDVSSLILVPSPPARMITFMMFYRPTKFFMVIQFWKIAHVITALPQNWLNAEGVVFSIRYGLK